MPLGRSTHANTINGANPFDGFDTHTDPTRTGTGSLTELGRAMQPIFTYTYSKGTNVTRTAGKYGLRPVPHGMRWGLKFGDYVDLTQLPPLPAGDFGHTEQVTKPWDIYLNDQLGDCVVASKEHVTRLWVAEGTGADTVTFSDTTTVDNYTLLGNYNPNDPNSDQGCDMLTAAHLWLTQGIADDTGTRHKPGIALQLQAGNWEQLLYATYLFDGVELGILVTPNMQKAFEAEQTWDTPDFNLNDVEGGHCVPVVARKDGLLELITWAEPQLLTKALYTAPQFNTVTMAYASQEKLHNGVDLEGLGWSDMRSDISKVARM